jgi:ERCC4-type nuclease
MKIVIDSREVQLYNLINQYKLNYINIEIEIKLLDLGDLEIWDDNNILFILERKTISDLLSSIQDKRYHEQSHRILSKFSPAKIIYLIEGILTQYKDEQKNIVNSCITSLSLEKGFHIFKTASTIESANLILQCVSKLIKLKKQNRKLCFEDKINDEPVLYTTFVKSQKKENISKENIYQLFLCQIPDVSSSSASAVMEYFKNDFSLLIQTVNNSPEELSLILCGNGEKKRKISKRIVSRIIEFLSSEQNISS